MNDLPEEILTEQEEAPSPPWWEGLVPPIYYAFDQDGVFIGEVKALVPTEEEGNWGAPESSTTEAPPIADKHQAAVWNGESWDLLPDWRSAVLYSTSDKSPVIAKLGQTPAEIEATDQVPDGEFDMWDGSAWVKDLDFELSILKSRYGEDVRDRATTIRLQISGTGDPCQLASWADKARRAERVITESGSVEDLAILRAEAERRNLGETPEALASLQHAKAQKLAEAVAVIDGIERQARDAINAAADCNALTEIIGLLEARAAEELEALQVGMNQ